MAKQKEESPSSNELSAQEKMAKALAEAKEWAKPFEGRLEPDLEAYLLKIYDLRLSQEHFMDVGGISLGRSPISLVYLFLEMGIEALVNRPGEELRAHAQPFTEEEWFQEDMWRYYEAIKEDLDKGVYSPPTNRFNPEQQQLIDEMQTIILSYLQILTPQSPSLGEYKSTTLFLMLEVISQMLEPLTSQEVVRENLIHLSQNPQEWQDYYIYARMRVEDILYSRSHQADEFAPDLEKE